MGTKRNNQGANVRKWREWREITAEVFADKIGVSLATLSAYERSDILDRGILDKMANVLDVPVQAIIEIGRDSGINIYSNTFHGFQDNASGILYNVNPIFNSVDDKVIELYERLLEAERAKNPSV